MAGRRLPSGGRSRLLAAARPVTGGWRYARVVRAQRMEEREVALSCQEAVTGRERLPHTDPPLVVKEEVEEVGARSRARVVVKRS